MVGIGIFAIADEVIAAIAFFLAKPVYTYTHSNFE
ncbi:hypothetical protein SGRA_1529 [Saprospira grandis str. Lewin]|uniref:Uncharacterized protein n=1 Tax=Saprospira grandis (strain Lewin) TaxID=984262 RepID=H6L992_SAPGL|nr:hypothetical protein SGRA_1529 [Saprospira grandis str. Lewin]